MPGVVSLATDVLERLQDLSDQVNVYDGQVPKGPGSTYVVLYVGAGAAASDRHGGSMRSLVWGFFVVCVGRQPREALTAAQLVRDQLTGWRPDPGESASPLEEVDLGNTLQRDDSDRSDIRYTLTLRYTLTTTRS